MSTFGLPLSRIDSDVLQRLADDGTREGLHLDYKRDLPGASLDERRDFLADVSSFANTGGGDIIFGLDEERDPASGTTARAKAVIGLKDFNFDATRRRLEQMLRSAVEPRLCFPVVEFHEVPCDGGLPCLVLRVKKSWAGPHMVTLDNWSRFFARTSSGKYQLDVGEIGRAFRAVDGARDRVRAFRADRIAKLVAGDAPVPTADPRMVLHVLPLDDAESPWEEFQGSKHREHEERFMRVALSHADEIFGGQYSWQSDYTLDGLLVRTCRADSSVDSYGQLFRDGGIEIVNHCFRTPDKKPAVCGTHVESALVGALTLLVDFWRALGVSAPFAVGAALLGAKGARMTYDKYLTISRGTIDRDPLVLPETLLDELPASPADSLRPLFDRMWNAAGEPRSGNYDAAGEWKPR
jgi:hypothetical protein